MQDPIVDSIRLKIENVLRESEALLEHYKIKHRNMEMEFEKGRLDATKEILRWMDKLSHRIEKK